MEITKEKISEIIKGLGKNNRIYQREAQFQFELAWELQKEIDKDGKVLLEVMSCRKNKGHRERFYSDIILQTSDKTGFIVIELKYKTKKAIVGNDKVELTGQGAQDMGRYYYLADIKRIELLKNQDKDTYTYPELGKFLGGYAIMLTNDPQYWDENKKNKEDAVDKQFRIRNGDKIAGRVDWCYKGEKKKWMKEAITFNGTYHFKWDDYLDEHNHFKYLITEIAKD